MDQPNNLTFEQFLATNPSPEAMLNELNRLNNLSLQQQHQIEQQQNETQPIHQLANTMTEFVQQLSSKTTSNPNRMKINAPSKLKGNEKPHELLGWITSVENYLDENAEESFKIRAINGLLDAIPTRFYNSLETKPTTAKEWLRMLESEYLIDGWQEQAEDQFYSLKQLSSVSTYVNLFRSKLGMLIERPSEGQLIRIFVRGLKPHIRRQLQAEINTNKRLKIAFTLNDAVSSAQFHERNFASQQPRYQRQNYHQQPHFQQNNFRKNDFDNQKPTPMEIDNVNIIPQQFKGKLSKVPGLRERILKDNRCLFCRQKGCKFENCPRRRHTIQQAELNFNEEPDEETTAENTTDDTNEDESDF